MKRRKKSRAIKRAFLLSLLSILLCLSMLAGSTFAWFTDSVSTGVNRIVAGNLDVDLLKGGPDGCYFSIAGGSGDLFSAADADSWMPGKTEIVYLAVENKGTLALRYNATLTVSNAGLAGALEFVVLDDAKYNDLEDLDWDTLATDEATSLAGVTSCLLREKVVVTPDEPYSYFALAVHMIESEELDSTFMNQSVVLDINVTAGQASVENDSFGDDYDAEAELPKYTRYDINELDRIGDQIKTQFGIEAAEVKSITFGKWDEQCGKLPGKTFADGVPQEFNADVRIFASRDSDGLYDVFYLVDDAYGYLSTSITYANAAFSSFTNLEAIDFACLDITGMRSMNSMFAGCAKLKSIEFGPFFDTSIVTDMQSVFRDCASLEHLDLTNWNTGSVVNMDSMFLGCTNLKDIQFGEQFTAAHVEHMANMFKSCASLTALDLSSFDTSNVTTMLNMFQACASLKAIDLSALDTSNVISMSYMFQGCTALETVNLGNMATGSVVTTEWMFGNCTNLEHIYVENEGMYFENANPSTGMFYQCEKLEEFDEHATDKAKAYAGGDCNGYFTAKIS